MIGMPQRTFLGRDEILQGIRERFDAPTQKSALKIFAFSV